MDFRTGLAGIYDFVRNRGGNYINDIVFESSVTITINLYNDSYEDDEYFNEPQLFNPIRFLRRK